MGGRRKITLTDILAVAVVVAVALVLRMCVGYGQSAGTRIDIVAGDRHDSAVGVAPDTTRAAHKVRRDTVRRTGKSDRPKRKMRLRQPLDEPVAPR